MAALSTSSEARGQVASALDSARAYLPQQARGLSQPVVYALLFEDNGFGGESIARFGNTTMRYLAQLEQRFAAAR